MITLAILMRSCQKVIACTMHCHQSRQNFHESRKRDYACGGAVGYSQIVRRKCFAGSSNCDVTTWKVKADFH